MINKDPQSSIFSSRNRGAFQIALLYLTIGVLWILFSDEAAAVLAPNQAVLTQISIYKGWGYVLVTALLLYWMIGLYTKTLSRAEWTLGESEKNYQELLQQASDGIFIADAQGQYTFVNEEACRLLGYTKDELLSMNLREVIAPEDLQKTPPRLDELKNGKTLLSERKFLRKDGSRIVCEISAKLLRDGSYQSIVRDITERKVTDEALLRSEQRYRSLFENMTNGFARCQMLYDESGAPKDFIYLDVNQAFENLTGLKNVLGKHVSTVIPGIHESNPELFEIYGRVALTGKPEKFETYVPGLGSGIWFSTSVYSTEKNFFVAVFEAITERKQAEAALRENEERLRLSLHAANQGLYDLNVQTGNAIVNREYAEMLGYDPDSFVETNAAWIERLHPDDREITANAYSNYIKGLTPEYRVEFRQKTKAGDWKWILSLGKVAEYDAAGMPLRMLGTHTDITERKQAENELRDQAALLDLANDAIIVRDLESKIMFWNRGAEQTYGWTNAEALGKITHDFLHTVFPASLEAVDQALLSESMWEGELTHTRRSGEQIIVTSRQVLQRDRYDQPSGILEINRDITERKRAEKELRESQDLFLKAFRANPAAMVITRLADGKFIDFNASYERIFEYTRDELIGKTSMQTNIITNPEERKTIVEKLLAEGHVYGYETILRAKSGKLINALFSIEMIGQADEQCMLSIIYDFTERKRVEEEIKRSNAELEQFAYVASHDLQEPLRAVAGMVQLLGQRYQGQLDERADEYIGHAVEAATRMQRLINDLLEYSRVNRLGKSFESTATEKSLNNALANLQIAIQESQAQITHDPLPSLMVDATQLTQVLQNLIGNAIKFRGARPLHIHIGAKKIEQAWQFEVSDNGIGIESKYYERIFLIFQRLHTRREYTGTGIGLALCKKIIERHNGQIWVESQPGLGSTFYFTIPERQL